MFTSLVVCEYLMSLPTFVVPHQMGPSKNTSYDGSHILQRTCCVFVEGPSPPKNLVSNNGGGVWLNQKSLPEPFGTSNAASSSVVTQDTSNMCSAIGILTAE